MKTTAFVLCLVLAFAAKGQQVGIMSVPADTIAARVSVASVQMSKAAWSRNTSMWVAVFGGIFTGLAMDRSAKVYDGTLAFGLGAVTAAGFVTLQLKGSRHDKRAAKALHFQ